MTTFHTAEVLRVTLHRLMAAHGEEQKDLARAIGGTQSLISKKLRGEVRITFEDLDRMASHYGITPADLISGPVVAVTKSLAAKESRAGTHPRTDPR